MKISCTSPFVIVIVTNLKIPLKKFVEWYPMRKSILSYTYCLEDTGIPQLLYNFVFIEETWTFRIVWFYTSNELR